MKDDSAVDQWDLYECQNCGDTYAGRSESAAQNYECFACGSSAGCFEQIDQDIYAEGGKRDAA